MHMTSSLAEFSFKHSYQPHSVINTSTSQSFSPESILSSRGKEEAETCLLAVTRAPGTAGGLAAILTDLEEERDSC